MYESTCAPLNIIIITDHTATTAASTRGSRSYADHPTPISTRLISVSCSVLRFPLKVANFILLFFWSGLNYMQHRSTQQEHARNEWKVQFSRCHWCVQAEVWRARKWLKTRRDLPIDIDPTSPPGSSPDPPCLSTGASSSDCDLVLWLQGFSGVLTALEKKNPPSSQFWAIGGCCRQTTHQPAKEA